MKNLHWILMALVLLPANGKVWAELEQNDQEQDLLLGFGCTDYDESHREGTSSDYVFQLGAGYFIRDYFSAGVRVGGQFIDDGFYSEGAANIGPYFKFNFFTKTDIVPYVGGQLSYWYQQSHYPRPFSEEEYQGVMYGPIAGLRYYLSEGTFLLAEYQYRMFCCGVGEIADRANVVMVGFGFTH